MNSAFTDLTRRIAAARASREQLRTRAALTVQRYAPGRLADDATALAKDMARETGARVRQHPFIAAGAVVALVAATFSKPLGRLADRLIDEWLPPEDEMPERLEPDLDMQRSDGVVEEDPSPATEQDQ